MHALSRGTSRSSAQMVAAVGQAATTLADQLAQARGRSFADPLQVALDELGGLIGVAATAGLDQLSMAEVRPVERHQIALDFPLQLVKQGTQARPVERL